MSQALGSKYELDEPLGRGATGTVWRGRIRATDEAVAVKVLREDLSSDPDIVTRFLRERSLLQHIRHVNLVRVRDLVVEGDVLALVMDLIDGPDLRDYLRERGRLEHGEAARLVADVMNALNTIHAAGITHRDLKPANILLRRTDDGVQPMLSDFGIARLADGPQLTRTHELLGTPLYIAPETALGKKPTPAADVYAAGIVLYELVSGRCPFRDSDPLGVVRQHIQEEASRPDGIPDLLWRGIQECLQKNPDDRPDATTVGRGLRRIADLLEGKTAVPDAKPGTDPGSTAVLRSGAAATQRVPPSGPADPASAATEVVGAAKPASESGTSGAKAAGAGGAGGAAAGAAGAAAAAGAVAAAASAEPGAETVPAAGMAAAGLAASASPAGASPAGASGSGSGAGKAAGGTPAAGPGTGPDPDPDATVVAAAASPAGSGVPETAAGAPPARTVAFDPDRTQMVARSGPHPTATQRFDQPPMGDDPRSTRLDGPVPDPTVLQSEAPTPPPAPYKSIREQLAERRPRPAPEPEASPSAAPEQGGQQAWPGWAPEPGPARPARPLRQQKPPQARPPAQQYPAAQQQYPAAQQYPVQPQYPARPAPTQQFPAAQQYPPQQYPPQQYAPQQYAPQHRPAGPPPAPAPARRPKSFKAPRAPRAPKRRRRLFGIPGLGCLIKLTFVMAVLFFAFTALVAYVAGNAEGWASEIADAVMREVQGWLDSLLDDAGNQVGNNGQQQ